MKVIFGMQMLTAMGNYTMKTVINAIRENLKKINLMAKDLYMTIKEDYFIQDNLKLVRLMVLVKALVRMGI